jgi:hypothetical protein
LNSRLNFRLCMTHLWLDKTPNLGVHQTGSSSVCPLPSPRATKLEWRRYQPLTTTTKSVGLCWSHSPTDGGLPPKPLQALAYRALDESQGTASNVRRLRTLIRIAGRGSNRRRRWLRDNSALSPACYERKMAEEFSAETRRRLDRADETIFQSRHLATNIAHSSLSAN